MSSRRNIRSVGLSRYDKPARLLQTINSNETAAKPAVKPPRNTKKRIRAPGKEIDISAPPVSSDEEDSGKAQKTLKNVFSSDDEREDSPDRGDIRPTTFQSSWTSTTSFSSNRSQTKYGASRSGGKYGSARSSQESKPSSSQMEGSTNAPPDELGPVRSQSLLRDPDKNYGWQPKRTSPSSPQPPRQKRPRKPTEGKEARRIKAGSMR